MGRSKHGDYAHLQDAFDNHVIRSEVRAEGFASWLLMRPSTRGGFTSAYWVRITAADSIIRVDGDIDVYAFRGGYELQGNALIAWMGGRELDGYVVEKMGAGTGRARLYNHSPEHAKEDLREMIRDAEEQIATQIKELEGRDESPLDAEDIEHLRWEISAYQAGVDSSPEYGGEPGAVEVCAAVYNFHDGSDRHIEGEDLCGVGERLKPGAVLAHLAVRRLHVLLSEQETHVVDIEAAKKEAREGLHAVMQALPRVDSFPVEIVRDKAPVVLASCPPRAEDECDK